MTKIGANVIDTVVLGGGLAGLTAALHLAERGVQPLILDADPQHFGGRLKAGPQMTLQQGDQTWSFAGEHGVHAVWSPYRNLQAMWVRHGIRPLLVPAQEEEWVLGTAGRVKWAEIGSVIRGSWIPAPLHYLGLFAHPRFWLMLSIHDFASLLRVFVTLLSALSIDPLLEDQPLQGMTLADVCKGWSPHLTSLFAGLSRNALPANPEQIPASGFFAFLRFYTLRRRDAWVFSYLPDASGQAMIAPLLQTLEDHGASLRLGCRVTQLEKDPLGWRVVWEHAGQSASVLARHVILAVDAPAATQLLQASPATHREAAVLNLPSGWSTAVIRLWFSRAPQRCGAEAGIFSGDFILDNFFWLQRIYNDYIRWGRATGGSAIESHIYGPPELLTKPDAALVAHALVDVIRTWPELKNTLLHVEVTRNDATHTLLHAGRPEDHLGVSTPWPGLYCCGDWVRDGSPAMFMERACVTGIKAANRVLAAHEIEPWPLLAHAPPEPLAWALELAMRKVRTRLRRRYQRARRAG